MPERPSSAPATGFSRGTTALICTIAAIGFLFDTYELLMLPLVAPPALAQLLGVAPNSPDLNRWVGLLFWVPAICGGLLGLLGGYLTDRFGRRRVLVWSILIYAFSAFAAGFATSAAMLLVLRCFTFAGVCVEFIAGVAWLAELFPEPKLRERVLGYTQAFGSLGGLLVTVVYGWAVKYAASWPAIAGGHDAWRYTLMSGVIPALPLIVVRPWLPESTSWQAKRAAGTLKRPSIGELFAPGLRRTTLVSTLMVMTTFAVAFGAIQQAPRIARTLPQVQALTPPEQGLAAKDVQLLQEWGGLAGRVLLALLVVGIASRRKLLRTFLVPALFVVPVVFWLAPNNDLSFLRWGLFACGLLVVSQMSFWGNYLPRVLPTHLRGTGEGFAVNVGGRMLGAGGAFLASTLANSMSLAHAAAWVGGVALLVGVTASFFLPEPAGEQLPE